MCFAVCVCVSALSGGALEKVELRDLLILEQSIFKNTFSKVGKVTRSSCYFPSSFPDNDSGIRADAAEESVIFNVIRVIYLLSFSRYAAF